MKWLLDNGFINVDNDGVTFIKNVNKDDGSVSNILQSIHMDDGLAACSYEAMHKEFIAAMSKDFDPAIAGSSHGFWAARSSRIVKGALCS